MGQERIPEEECWRKGSNWRSESIFIPHGNCLFVFLTDLIMDLSVVVAMCIAIATANVMHCIFFANSNVTKHQARMLQTYWINVYTVFILLVAVPLMGFIGVTGANGARVPIFLWKENISINSALLIKVCLIHTESNEKIKNYKAANLRPHRMHSSPMNRKGQSATLPARCEKGSSEREQ